MTPEQTALAKEYLRRKQIREDIVNSLHPMQRKVFDDPSQYRSVCASRRGGKTWVDVAMITVSLMETPREVYTVFLAPTGPVGKSLVWNELLEMNKKYQLGWTCREHPTPEITTPAGAKFMILGIDDSGQLGKLRGKKYALVIADEAKEYTKFLRELVDEIIGPAFIGVGGRMVVSGTPGRACTERDYWYSVCHGLKPGWSYHHWTLHENKWVKDPEGELEKILAAKEWTRENVIFQREYLGVWKSSDEERVYAYNEARNSVKTLDDVCYIDPQGKRHPYDPATWVHTMGVDYGHKPAPCAWVVWASHPKSRDVFCVYAKKTSDLLSDEAAVFTAGLVERFRPVFVMGDGGGLGAPYISDFNRRHADRLGVWITLADKKGKRDHIEIMSEEFKVARLIIVLSEAGDYAQELSNLGWKDDTCEQENTPAQANHCCDGGLYGFMKHKAYFHKPEKPPLTQQERETEERRERSRKAQALQRRGLLR